jgi:hypothetical protein
MGKRLGRQGTARRLVRPARGQGGQRRGVVGRVAQNNDAAEVLGRRPQEGHAADVDLLDGFGRRHVRAGDGGGERVEVADDQVDGGNGVGGQLGCVRGRVAGQDAAVDGRVQRFDAPAEHLRRAGQFGHVAHGQPGGSQRLRRAAAGDQFPAQRRQAAAQFDQPCFVVNGKDGSLGHGHGV